ncbi:unnamed protein product [Arctia plantaginis]|uniref:BESS domain-containing protein n=1 Tax=Arctia plantaginis TaxID=874455 RepID=A0A8S1B0M5_ARCPL|nr:unnamed protein product [Arctia plantaginis]
MEIRVQTVTAVIHSAPKPSTNAEPRTSKITSNRNLASSKIDYDEITLYPDSSKTLDTNKNNPFPDLSLSTLHLSGLDVDSIVSLADVLILPLEDIILSTPTPTTSSVEKETPTKEQTPEPPLTSLIHTVLILSPSFVKLRENSPLVQPSSAAVGDSIKVIQRRWKNLRACFSRKLRCQKDVKSGQAAPKRKRYVYFDKLLFLVPSMEPGRETSSNVTTLDIEAISESDSSTPAITRPKQEKKSNKSYEESLLEILRDKSNHQDIQTLPDPDNYFALSLVPLLKSIPPDQKIDAQIAILNTLKYYSQSSSNYNNFNSTAATYILP